jgi:uncharacterized membrane protein YphA (DoxX/SURF4 family)
MSRERPLIATESPEPFSEPPINPLWFGRGMAAIRIFFGLIVFANGLAKLDASWAQIDIGAYHANLITRQGARNILTFETNRRQVAKSVSPGTQVPYLKRFVNDVVLAHWNIFQWVTTAIEVGAGALLILGLASRFGALVDLGQQLFLALVYFSSNRWLFEQPHEYVPLIVLALVPSGRVWGLDRRLIRAQPRLRRWPF